MAQEKKVLDIDTRICHKRHKMTGVIINTDIRERENKKTVFYQVFWSDASYTWEPRSRFTIVEKEVTNV